MPEKKVQMHLVSQTGLSKFRYVLRVPQKVKTAEKQSLGERSRLNELYYTEFINQT